MNGPPFRPDHRPRPNNRFRRRPPNWNRGGVVGRGSGHMFEDGEIQSQSPVPAPPSPPWRRQHHRFPRSSSSSFKRQQHRRNDFTPSTRSLSPSPQRSRPPYLGPVPLLEIPNRRRSRFDITPDHDRNGWQKPDSTTNSSVMRNTSHNSDQIRNHPLRIPSQGPLNSSHSSPKSDALLRSDSVICPIFPIESGTERNISLSVQLEPKSSAVSGTTSQTGSKLNSPRLHAPSEPKISSELRSIHPSNNHLPLTVDSKILSKSDRDPVIDSEPTTCVAQTTTTQSESLANISSITSSTSHRLAFGEGLASILSGSDSTLNQSAIEPVVSKSAELTVESHPLSSSAAAVTSEMSLLSTDPIPQQSELLLQIQKLDDEIADIELKITHQRNLIEEKTSAGPESENLTDNEVMMVIAESEDSDEILTENRRLAALSAQVLAKQNPGWLNERLTEGVFFEPLYREPSRCSSYLQVEEDLRRNRHRLLRAIRHRKLTAADHECRLALEWWNHYRDWRSSMSKTELKSFPPLRYVVTPDQREYYAGRIASIPNMLSEQDRRAMSWRSRNALIEDPRAHDQYRKLINPWSEQEKAVFRKKFSKFPKNFSKVASFLPNKSIGDCVAYYYSSKTLVNYKALVKKYQQCLLTRKGIDVTGESHVEGMRSSRIDAPASAVQKDQHEVVKPSAIPRELLKLAEDLSRNNLEVQSGRSRAGKRRRTDSDLSNVSLDTLV